MTENAPAASDVMINSGVSFDWIQAPARRPAMPLPVVIA